MTGPARPLFLVVEGVNGTGKSTYARELAERLPDIRIFRPLEAVPAQSSSETEEFHSLLHTLGVAAKAPAAHLVAADVLGLSPGRFLFDRSMPSAIAYGRVIHRAPELLEDDAAEFLLRLWEDRLCRARTSVGIVLLEASIETLKVRRPHLIDPLAEPLAAELAHWVGESHLPQLTLDTSSLPLEKGVEQALRFVASLD